MGTLLASTSQAAGATTTSAAYAYNADNVVTTTCANAFATPPSEPTNVVLQGSLDSVTWNNLERRTFGMAPGVTYTQSFDLAKYSGAGNTATPQSQFGLTGAWAYYRLVFSGNQGNAVTVAANDGLIQNMIILPLIATTATTGGAAGAWTPPEGTQVIIAKVIINVITGSTGAASVNAGVAASATTSNSGLIGATSVHTSGTVIDSFSTGAIAINCPAGSSVTFTASATLAGMVANAYIFYIEP